MATINPYINFNGNAEEAFNFYKSVFGGEFEAIVRFKDLESAEFPVPEEDENKIMRILLLGSGGREHALAWKMAKSSQLDHLFIAPGNAGTRNHGTNVALKVTDFKGIKKFVLENEVERELHVLHGGRLAIVELGVGP